MLPSHNTKPLPELLGSHYLTHTRSRRTKPLFKHKSNKIQTPLLAVVLCSAQGWGAAAMQSSGAQCDTVQLLQRAKAITVLQH